MTVWDRFVATVGGRRTLFALGGIYVFFGLREAYIGFTEATSVWAMVFLVFFMLAPGVVLLVGAYQLPDTDINAQFYSTITAWCLGAILVLTGFLLLYHFQPSEQIDNPIRGVVIITGFAVIPAYAGGVNQARAKTRAFELDQRNQELQKTHADLKAREAELERVRDRMEFALINTDAVVWEWDVENDHASYYPSEESLFGTTIENWEDFAAVIHPDDRDAVQRTIEESLETGEPKHEEVRIIRDGEVRWIEAPGRPVTDTDGSTRMIGVARDITDRKTFERNLQESNERLEEFAYVASHDLQEPLRMITSYLNLLEDRYGEELDEETHEFIDYAVNAAVRMREMIQDLLAYSSLDTDAQPLEPIDPEDVVAEVLDNLQLQIEETQATIDVGELPTVEADENQLEQVFQNLVSNAIKYRGEEPPRIEISASRQDGMCQVQVADNGIGIDPKYSDQVFEVFKRLHGDGEYPGTGIGLALCKKIVERHGGDIWVDSKPGEGATFCFTIPLGDSATA